MAAVQTTTTGVASPYRLMVRTARRTWIRVRMDNGQTYEEKLKAGAVRVWASDQPFAITLRDTGGVRGIEEIQTCRRENLVDLIIWVDNRRRTRGLSPCLCLPLWDALLPGQLAGGPAC